MILRMAKVQLIGPRDLLPRALAFLQERGVIQLRATGDERGADGVALVRPLVPMPDADALARSLVEAAERAAALAARLPFAHPTDQSEALPEPGGPALLARLGALEQEVGALVDRRSALVEEQEAVARFERLMVALSPIRHRVDPGLGPEIHGLFLKEDPEALALLAQETGRITGGNYDLDARPLGDGNVGVLLTVPRSASRELATLLFAHGVEEVRLPPGFAGKPLIEVLLLLAARRHQVPRELAEIDVALSRLASMFGPALAAAQRSARAALARLQATEQCGATRFSFVVAGWTPASHVATLRAAVDAEMGGAVALLSTRRCPASGATYQWS